MDKLLNYQIPHVKFTGRVKEEYRDKLFIMKNDEPEIISIDTSQIQFSAMSVLEAISRIKEEQFSEMEIHAVYYDDGIERSDIWIHPITGAKYKRVD